MFRQQRGFPNRRSLRKIRGVIRVDSPNLPTEPDPLRALLASTMLERDGLLVERDALVVERAELLARIERQQHLLLQLKRLQFGPRSERLPEDHVSAD